MNRRQFLIDTAVTGAAVTGLTGMGALFATDNATNKSGEAEKTRAQKNKLTPPATGKIPVAVAISQDVTLIDFAGPWEVFNNVMLPERGPSMDDQMPFDLFTVSDRTELLTSGSLKLVPNYRFDDVPQPRVVVIPAQQGSEQLRGWLKKISQTADVTMSVCTGAFQLGKAGLLSGKSATTHHEFLDRFEKEFPDVQVKRGVRFTENEKISTAGGLSSGIDLALHVVERYFGREVAQRTADYMEYQGKGWIV
jgi:transcriptional regulator GlxA family with amidase domain